MVRDDSNRLVAGPVTVTPRQMDLERAATTRSKSFKTLTVSANAAGKFSYTPRKTATKAHRHL